MTIDKKDYIVSYLIEWQTDMYEEIETATDIRVFNTIGTIIQLLDAGMMSLDKTYDFISDILSLDEKEKEALMHVITVGYEAYAYKSEEEEKDGDEESV